jgi:hypothetical protein
VNDLGPLAAAAAALAAGNVWVIGKAWRYSTNNCYGRYGHLWTSMDLLYDPIEFDWSILFYKL